LQKSKILFTVALGITDRPNRWHTIGKFFLSIAKSLEQFGVESYFVHHSAVNLPEFKDGSHNVVMMDNHDNFDSYLEKLKPDYIFVWNGNFKEDSFTAEYGKKHNCKMIYGELGWFPQSQTIHFDFCGTNYRSSIANIDLQTLNIHPELDIWTKNYLSGATSIDFASKNYIFVPLQDENDTNIRIASPYEKMNDFVKDLARSFPEEKFIVRKHPRFMEVFLEEYPNVEYRNDGNAYDWIKNSKCTIGVNSTVLLEALMFDIPVISLGKGLASGLGVFREFSSAKNINLSQKLSLEETTNRKKLLSELIFNRMLYRNDLTNPDKLANYFVFKEILRKK